MKKVFLTAVFIFCFSAVTFGELFEGLDYNVEYIAKPANMADVLHVNFISLMPSPSAAADIVKQQLQVYGEKQSRKNIVGTAWHTITGDEKDLQKIKFSQDLGAYVWMGRSKRVVSFTNYLYILKRERDNQRKAQRTKAA
ncbi:MAG: hypothetical protein LBV66_01740 [Elusimicrobiota bacterium]|jgi:hypothetical protein|nr:hypothetical protein [Elusimicrobiota bacterium]